MLLYQCITVSLGGTGHTSSFCCSIYAVCQLNASVNELQTCEYLSLDICTVAIRTYMEMVQSKRHCSTYLVLVHSVGGSYKL